MQKLQNPSENRGRHLAVCILASGSKGNAIYFSDGDTSILVDAGLSGREMERRLQLKGLSAKNLNAIVVSHEHTDHTRGVGILSRRYNLPVYINEKTYRSAPVLGNITDRKDFKCGHTFRINGLSIHPFSVSHDAGDPSGFIIGQNGNTVGLATDLGIPTALVKSHLAGCRMLIIEANHDSLMLETGPYPWPLKQRIKSRTGHLSNDASKKLLKDLLHNRLEHVVLAHLSEINNTSEKALSTVGPAVAKTNIRLTVASQYVSSEIFYLK